MTERANESGRDSEQRTKNAPAHRGDKISTEMSLERKMSILMIQIFFFNRVCSHYLGSPGWYQCALRNCSSSLTRLNLPASSGGHKVAVVVKVPVELCAGEDGDPKSLTKIGWMSSHFASRPSRLRTWSLWVRWDLNCCCCCCGSRSPIIAAAVVVVG